jgi:hypothetical protein
MSESQYSSMVSNALVSYLFESHNQEVNYIRSEMHEEQQRLDRAEIDCKELEEAEKRANQRPIRNYPEGWKEDSRDEADEAEENERAYRETMQRLGLVHDPAPFETDEYRQFIGAGCRRLAAAGGAQ